MTVVDEQIASNAGDGHEYGPDTSWKGNGYDSDGWALGFAVATDSRCDAGLVFEGVAVPNAATIDVAYLEIFAKWQGSDVANTPIAMKGFAEDNPSTFATDGSNRPSTRTKTTASVTQTLGTITDETFKQLDSIVTVVQEIVNRAGFVSGNNMGFVIEENASASAQRGQFNDYNYSAANAAKLHIEYTSGGAAVKPKTLMTLGVG